MCPSGRELKSIEAIAMLDEQLIHAVEDCEDFIRHIPNGWRDLRMVQKVVARLMTAIYDIVPGKTLKHFQDLVNYGEISVRFKPVGSVQEKILMHGDEAEVLVDTCLAEKCSLCMLEGPDVKRCPLRKCLIHVAPPTDFEEERPIGCEYQGISHSGEAHFCG